MAANHYYNDQLSVSIIKLLLGRFFRPEQINTARPKSSEKTRQCFVLNDKQKGFSKAEKAERCFGNQ